MLQRLGRVVVYGLLAAVLVLGILWLVYQQCYAGRIYRNITINGVDVSGMTASQAVAALEDSTQADRLPFLALSAGERTWLVAPSQLGITPLVEPAVAQALAMGRNRGFRQDLITQIKLYLGCYAIITPVQMDTSRMMVYVRELASEEVHSSRAAQVVLSGIEIEAQKESAGREIDYIATQQAIQQAFINSLGQQGWVAQRENVAAAALNPDPLSVNLVFCSIIPRLTDYEFAADRAKILMSSPITLQAGIEEIGLLGERSIVTKTWVIDQAMLASWLELDDAQTAEAVKSEVSLNIEMVSAYLQGLNTQISRPPMEGSYHYDTGSGQIITQKPPQVGYSLDVPAAVELVQKLAFSQERTGQIPLRSVQPNITLDDLQALLPLELISSGHTVFELYPAERLENIRRAAEDFEFVVVAPGVTFSFLANLGAVTIANGYSESWVIYGNQTVRGPGGGVCQVATTLFRAAFYGGFPIVERTPHSYRIARYEPPVGLDAAVFSPSTDLKFTNDLDTPIIIMNSIDPGGAITFFIYGMPPNRSVRIEGEELSNPVPAGEPITQVDDKLAPGERILVERAHDGIDAVLTRVIEQDGQVVSREEFFSRYVPWPARYLVGP